MDEKELKKLTDDINGKFEALQKAVEKGEQNASAIKSELTELLEGATKIDDKPIAEYAKTVQEHANTLEARIKEIEEKGAQKVESVELQLDRHLKSDDYKNAVKAYKNNGDRRGLMGLSKVLTVGSDLGGTYPIQPSREPGVSYDPRRQLFIWELIQKGTTDSNRVDWIERVAASESHQTEATSENAQFGESDYAWTQSSMPVEKLTDMIKMTREMLEDTEFVRSEIITILNYNIPYFRETQLLSGTGMTPALKGLITYAKAFALATGAEKRTNAQHYDALQAAILQVLLGNGPTYSQAAGFQPNAIVMNPVDVFNMRGNKDANENYIFPPALSTDGLMLDGVRIYQTQNITAGTFLVGDLSVGKAFVKRGIEINFWDQNSTDPEYDRVTVTASHRLAHRVTTNGAFGLVTGTFAAAIAALTA